MLGKRKWEEDGRRGKGRREGEGGGGGKEREGEEEARRGRGMRREGEGGGGGGKERKGEEEEEGRRAVVRSYCSYLLFTDTQDFHFARHTTAANKLASSEATPTQQTELTLRSLKYSL